MFGRKERKTYVDDTWISELNQPQAALTNDGTGWASFGWNFDSDAKGVGGVKVGPRTMLKVSAVKQAVMMISGDIATSPLELHACYVDKGEETIQRSHPSHKIACYSWSRYVPANLGWERLVTHAMVWSDGYAYLEKDNRGRVMAMHNLPPGTCHPHRVEVSGGRYTYGYMIQLDEESPSFFVEQGDIFHLRGGLPVEIMESEPNVDLMRDMLSVSLAAQKYKGSFFANGAQSGGIITVPPGVPTEARERMEAQIQKKSQADNWFRTMVLRDGAQWHQTTVDAKSNEMIAIEEQITRDVARAFNIPGFKLNLSDSVSYNSSELGQRAYLTGCLNHWLTKIQGEARVKLLPARHQTSGEFKFMHNTEKLLEPDSETRNNILAIQRQNMVITANEWRTALGMTASDDPEADTLLNPNVTVNEVGGKEEEPEVEPEVIEESPAPEQPEEQEEELQTPEPQQRRRTISSEHASILSDAVAQAAKRVCTPLGNRSKSVSKFASWIESEDTVARSIFSEELEPICQQLELSADASDIAADGLFNNLLDRVCVFMEPHYREEDLRENVAAASHLFKTEAFALTLNLLGLNNE